MNEKDRKITDRLLFDFPTTRTEIGIIMGSRGVTGTNARVTAKLYKDGHFKQILLTGGLHVYQPDIWAILKISSLFQPLEIINDDFLTRNCRESDYAYKILVEQGVLEADILYEGSDHKGTNTSENFQNIAVAIARYGFKTATVITPAYHQLRAIETCSHIMPELTAFPHAVYPFGITRDNWNKTLVAGVVKGEFAKLNSDNPNNYYTKGVCKPVNIADLKRKALAL